MSFPQKPPKIDFLKESCCQICKKYFQRGHSLGKLECKFHTGHISKNGTYTCCGKTEPCMKRDHWTYDDGYLMYQNLFPGDINYIKLFRGGKLEFHKDTLAVEVDVLTAPLTKNGEHEKMSIVFIRTDTSLKPEDFEKVYKKSVLDDVSSGVFKPPETIVQ